MSLNPGETQFVVDLRAFFNDNPEFFANQEMYLLRNMSRGRGIGFFEAGNFYPDFIIWLIVDGKQYVTFVDPKGIRNLEGPDDPKIQFHKTIKDIEVRMGDPNVILNSFIISNTPFQQVKWWESGIDKADLEAANVLFQKDNKETYIAQLLGAIVPVV